MCLEAPRDGNPPLNTASLSGTWRSGMGRCPSLSTPVHTNPIPYRLPGTCMAYILHVHYLEATSSSSLAQLSSCQLHVNMCYCTWCAVQIHEQHNITPLSFNSSVIVHIWTSSFSQTHMFLPMSLPQSTSHTYLSSIFLLPRPVLGIRASMQSHHTEYHWETWCGMHPAKIEQSH